jgi:diguanylate cyclase (GGDEF)-like protein
MARVDARLREMQFLARLEREGVIRVETPDRSGPERGSPERQMIVTLLRDEHVNGTDCIPAIDEDLLRRLPTSTAYMNVTFPQVRSLLLCDASVDVRISHKGRVRLSELEQQLKTGRDRDPTGLCMAKRHLMTDLAIAILSVYKDAPLSLAFLDMNGLKAINDTHGHAAGDHTIRAYLETVIAVFGEHGEAYRGEGGDEAVVILPGVDDERAGMLLDSFVHQLGKDAVLLGDARASMRLTCSCGTASTTDPGSDAALLHDRADKAMYRAKAESKKHAPRVSTVAVGDGEVRTYAPSEE